MHHNGARSDNTMCMHTLLTHTTYHHAFLCLKHFAVPLNRIKAVGTGQYGCDIMLTDRFVTSTLLSGLFGHDDNSDCWQRRGNLQWMCCEIVCPCTLNWKCAFPEFLWRVCRMTEIVRRTHMSGSSAPACVVFVCVCVCVCVYVCVVVCVCVCVCSVCVDVYICVYADECMCMCVWCVCIVYVVCVCVLGGPCAVCMCWVCMYVVCSFLRSYPVLIVVLFVLVLQNKAFGTHHTTHTHKHTQPHTTHTHTHKHACQSR